MRLVRQIGEWLDARLQLGTSIREIAEHPVPRETASWFYVFGSAAFVIFILQIFTGILLAFIYVLLAMPRFVFLDRAGTALDSGQVRKILKMLSKNAIGFMNIGEIDDAADLYDAILEIHDRGDWTWRKISIDAQGTEA